jgi:hypothetical protein
MIVTFFLHLPRDDHHFFFWHLPTDEHHLGYTQKKKKILERTRVCKEEDIHAPFKLLIIFGALSKYL